MTQTPKEELRALARQKRRAIPQERRDEAAKAIVDALDPIMDRASFILSYISFNDELDTTLLNQKIAKSGRLVLSRIVGTELQLFQVHDLEKELRKGSFFIPEPDTDLCKAISPSIVSIALVPAIAFDAKNHRLGYGKGFYDRFLVAHQNEMETIGIGFKEQLSTDIFPSEKHDIHLSRIVLV